MSVFGGKSTRSGKESAKGADSTAERKPSSSQSGKKSGKPDDTNELDFKSMSEFANRPDHSHPRKAIRESAEPPRSPSVDPSTTLNMEVLTATAGQAPVIEVAAILYANGQVKDAKARLLHAIQFEALGESAERVWMMLLDLHQELGEQAEFDARALDFAVMFERSAPAWRGRLHLQDPLSQTSGGSVVQLTGRLSAASATQIAKLREHASKSRLLRIDFSRLKGADAEGCKLLLELLRSMRKGGGDAMFSGESVLLGALSSGTPAGDRDVDPALWLLRLEILQWQGRQSEFDDVALAYAVTYEVSPPSFEARAARAVSVRIAGAGSGAAEGALRAPREIVGASDAFIRKIVDGSRDRSTIQVDCAELKRIDFVSAGNLLNLASRLKSEGKLLELRHLNTLVAALLDVMGISEFAKVTPRR